MRLSLKTLKQLNLAFAILCVIGCFLLLLAISGLSIAHRQQNQALSEHGGDPKSIHMIQRIQLSLIGASATYTAILAGLGFWVAFRSTPSKRLLQTNAIMQLLQIPFGTALGIATLMSTADDETTSVKPTELQHLHHH
jgi:ABC-type Fe3+ transport system permease subunit